MEKKKQQQSYENYVRQKTPVHNLPVNMAKAFVTGGVICVIGQGILNICEKAGLGRDEWKLVFDASGASECSAYRMQSVSADRKVGRCRSAGTDYGICQFSGSTGD